ncbi:STAS domain-containing protein [Brevibacillus sp. SYP-B805]|uniref:STAS domain-containing protein n=1 Tax=Brevibacillus sp. SYP-B805 TaxID=1578199 RepID=UPI0013EDCA71|nr:STAS domain-containing protein [Brevibacillus sp. SYP-B805]NGQ94332.1 STAS domain-containing protein [Brevibacillus sp. SYP-B805]
MNYRIEEEQDHATLYLEGELDMTVGSKLGEVLRQCGERYSSISVDFQGVTFVDSSGIGSLYYATKELLAGGRAMEIVNIREEILDILRILGFAEALGVPLKPAS